MNLALLKYIVLVYKRINILQRIQRTQNINCQLSAQVAAGAALVYINLQVYQWGSRHSSVGLDALTVPTEISILLDHMSALIISSYRGRKRIKIRTTIQ